MAPRETIKAGAAAPGVLLPDEVVVDEVDEPEPEPDGLTVPLVELPVGFVVPDVDDPVLEAVELPETLLLLEGVVLFDEVSA
jgi:hypothetical protein